MIYKLIRTALVSPVLVAFSGLIVAFAVLTSGEYDEFKSTVRKDFNTLKELLSL